MSIVMGSRPRGVSVAVALLCIMYIVGSISGAYQLGHNHLEQSLSQQLPYMHAIQYGGLAFGLALNLFFAVMTFFRHNWARIVVLVFFILGVLLSLPTYLGVFHMSPQAEIFGVFGFLVQLMALILLFTGHRSLWFKRAAP